MVDDEIMGWAWASDWAWAWASGALSPWSSSCSSGGREFVHEFGRPAEKGVRSLILKE